MTSRSDDIDRICAMAGVTQDGAPTPEGISGGINRDLKPAWRASSHPVADAWELGLKEAVDAERARCAGLAAMMAEMLEARAAEIRINNTYTGWQLWPPKKAMFVAPGAEYAARQHDEAALIIRNIIKAIEAGWPVDEVRIGKPEEGQ